VLRGAGLAQVLTLPAHSMVTGVRQL
jgi:hypothetical protein